MSETVRYNIVLNDEVSAKLAKIEAKFESLESSIKDSNKALGGLGKSMSLNTLLTGANLALQAGQQIWGMAEASIRSAGAMQANTNAIKVASGSISEFNTNQKFLNSLISKASLPIQETTEGLKMWTAATMNSSIKGNTARQTFEDISIATASMGIDAESTKGIFLALSQMMSKGTVQAEELRGQLGERLPGAFALMAQSMGVTEQKLGKMMENGEVMSAQVLPKFAAMLRDKFGGGLQEANKGINATLTRLDNLKTQGIIAMTQPINDLLLKVESLAVAFSKLDFEPIGEAVMPLFNMVDMLGDSFARLFGTTENGNNILKILATGFHAVMSPIYLAIGAVRVLSEAIIGLGEAMNLSMRGDFAGAAEKLKASGSRISEAWAETQKNTTGALIDIWDDRGKRNEENLSWLDKMPTESKAMSSFSSPTASTAKDSKKKLKEANANIVGGGTRNISVEIQNLIGQNTNNISRAEDKETLNSFTKMLLQTLQQEIVNINLAQM